MGAVNMTNFTGYTQAKKQEENTNTTNKPTEKEE